MFDFQEFYLRMAEKLPAGAVIAEVGIADGASAIFLAEAFLNLDKPFKLWLIDNLAYGGSDQLHTILCNITAAGLGGAVEILPLDSLNASCRFPDNHFDLVFIDASHRYEFTKADLRLWFHKIKSEGGILAGHDFNDNEGQEVKLAVNEILASYVVEETSKGYGLWWHQIGTIDESCYEQST